MNEEKQDFNNFEAETLDELKEFITEPTGEADETSTGGNRKVDEVIATIQDSALFFKGNKTEGYATLPSGIHVPIDSEQFEDFILSVAYAQEPRFYIGQTQLQSIKRFLNFEVISNSNYQTKKVFKRYGHDDLGNIWILADTNPVRYIKISPGELEDNLEVCPVVIVLNKEALALPKLTQRAELHLLNKYMNVEKYQRPLIHTFLVECAVANGQFSILQLLGQESTGKSTLIKILHKLIDPNEDMNVGLSDEWSFYIMASQTHLVDYDNLEKDTTHNWVNQALSRIATGTAYFKRKLHTNSGTNSIRTANPQIIASIEQVIDKSDVLSRSFVINLPIMDSKDFKLDSAFWDAFDNDYPYIFTGLVKAIQHVLKNKDKASRENLERMTESHLVGRTLESFEGLNWGMTYDDSLANNKEVVAETIIDEKPVAQWLKLYIEAEKIVEKELTPTQWLEEMNKDQVTFDVDPTEMQIIQQSLPRTSRTLGSRFAQVQKPLERFGIKLTQRRTGSSRFWKITNTNINVTDVTDVTPPSDDIPSNSDNNDINDIKQQEKFPWDEQQF